MVRTHTSFLAGLLRHTAAWRRVTAALSGAAILVGLAVSPLRAGTPYYYFTGALDLYGSFAVLHSDYWTGSSIQANYASGDSVVFTQSLTLHSNGTMTFEEYLNGETFGPVTYDVQDIPLDPYPESFTSVYSSSDNFSTTTGSYSATPSATDQPKNGSQQVGLDGNGDWVAAFSGNLSNCANGEGIIWSVDIRYP